MKIRYLVIATLLLTVILTGCNSESPQAIDTTPPDTHQHTWVDATCVSPVTCSECFEEAGNPLGHSWEIVDNIRLCSRCQEVDETYVVEVGPLYGVPQKDDLSALQKYLNLYDQNNVQNNATFLMHNGWIYGQAWDDDGNSQFVKVRTDGNDFTVLDTGFAHHIYIVDNYIYYMTNKGIFKMKTSGEAKQQLSECTGSMQIVDRHIYFADGGSDDTLVYDESGNAVMVKPEHCHLFRCDLDGNNVTEIINKPTFHFYVFSDGILYQDDNDNCSLHVRSLDGNTDIKLNNEISYWPIYDGEFIYYVKEDSDRSIWKVKPNGTEDQLVANYNTYQGIMLDEDYIYFIYNDDSDRLYRINKDGSDLTLITQDTNIRYVQLIGDMIKYTKRTDDLQYIDGNYFCDFDGSGKWDFLDIAY